MDNTLEAYPQYGKQLNSLKVQFDIQWFDKSVTLGTQEAVSKTEFAPLHQSPVS